MFIIHRHRALLFRIATTSLLLAGCGSSGSDPVAAEPPPPAEPERELVLAGSLERPQTLTLTGLKALPAATQTVDYLSGTTPQSHVYTGTSLWSLLDGAGIQVDASRNNDVLNRYVVATGGDGYRAVFSLGEINPNFGNRESLVAHTEAVGGAEVPLDDEGLLRVTAPGDVKGGRYVSDLVRLDVFASASTVAATGVSPSTQFSVAGAVQRPGTYDLAALQALTLPVVSQTVGADVYKGVGLWSFLETEVGLVLDPAAKNDVLGKYVVATGADGYKAVISLGELNPGFGNQPDLIAYEINDQPLTDNGFARLVVPNDVRRGRFVSNLISLEVFSAPAIP